MINLQTEINILVLFPYIFVQNLLRTVPTGIAVPRIIDPENEAR